MGNGHVKAWALVVIGFGYFAVVMSVLAAAASFFTGLDSGLADFTFRMMALSGIATSSLLILVGSYVLWKVEHTEDLLLERANTDTALASD
jgi:hypothetical protein